MKSTALRERAGSPMLNEHLALTTPGATARLQQRRDDDIAAFDKIHTQAISMADALADGIAKQFPWQGQHQLMDIATIHVWRRETDRPALGNWLLRQRSVRFLRQLTAPQRALASGENSCCMIV